MHPDFVPVLLENLVSIVLTFETNLSSTTSLTKLSTASLTFLRST